MNYTRTFGNGEELKITDDYVTIGSRKVSPMLQKAPVNDKGIVAVIDGKYGLFQADLEALKERTEILSNRPVPMTKGEIEREEYYKHYNLIERIR